jgi:RIO kinase 1
MLRIDSVLTGQYAHAGGAVDVDGVMREIDDARDEEAARLQRMATPT